MSDEERRRRRLTYIGKRIATSGGLMGFWIDEDGNEYGYRKLAPEAAPGGRYDVTLSADGSVFLGGEDGPRYVDRLPVDDERVLAWSARDRTARATHAQAARARRDSKADALAEACRPLRKLYAGERTATGRSALLAALIEQITPAAVASRARGGPLDGQDDGRRGPRRRRRRAGVLGGAAPDATQAPWTGARV